jgi:hypothetical protein
MLDYRKKVLAALAGGPVEKWPLLRNKGAGFRVAYQSMLASGQIVESGTGAIGNSVYVGLPGVVFPEPRLKGIHIKPADIELMTRAGHSEAEARAILGGRLNDFGAYVAVLTRAEEQAAKLARDRDAERWETKRLDPPKRLLKPVGRPKKELAQVVKPVKSLGTLSQHG